jgi:hypothetical protein
MVFILILLLFSPLSLEALLITEVQVAGEKTSECYVKIYNPEEESIDISGFSLRKKTSTGNDTSLRLFPKGSIINGKEYFIWASSKESSFPERVGADAFSVQTLSLNNSIALFDSSKNLLDALSWGEGENQYLLKAPVLNPGKGQVIKRKKDGGLYSNLEDNSLDFYLYPPPLLPLSIEDLKTEKEEKKRLNPFLISFFSSILLASIILLLRKKWPDTVTLEI